MIADELQGLGREEREACRAALRDVGASEEDIDAWIPAPPPRPVPAWAQHPGPHVPPRLIESPA